MTKILYYNYFINKNNNKTNASIVPLLDHILKLPPTLGHREKEILLNGSTERILLTEIHTPDKGLINQNINSDMKLITFARKRKKNPYVANDGSDAYEQISIDKKVLELATALIIPGKNLILLQRNIHSTTIKAISKYLSEFTNDDIDIKFEPINIDKKINDVLNSKYISKLEFKFSTEKLSQIIGNINKKNTNSVFVELLEVQNKMANITASPDTTVSFSNGRFRNSLNTEESINFIKFIQAICPDDSPLINIKVKYKTTNYGKIKEVDLAADGIRSFSIDLESNSGKDVGNSIFKEYFTNPNNIYDEQLENLENYNLDNKTDFIQY